MTLIARSALLTENTPNPLWRPGSAPTVGELIALPHTLAKGLGRWGRGEEKGEGKAEGKGRERGD